LLMCTDLLRPMRALTQAIAMDRPEHGKASPRGRFAGLSSDDSFVLRRLAQEQLAPFQPGICNVS
jgi:hypothetical protein